MTDTFECSQYGSHPVGPQDTVILPGDTFRKMHFDLAERDATILSLTRKLEELEERREAEIVAAYKRGDAWGRENPVIYVEYVSKAALDYADKIIGAPKHGGALTIANETVAGLAQKLAEARLKLEELEKGKWQPIDTAPKDGTRVLGWCNAGNDRDCRLTMEWNADRSRWIVSLNAFWEFDPTHWQPLPSPPQIMEEGK
jgi:hypothetical protein